MVSNININNTLAALKDQSPSQVTKAIHNASQESGVDFAYLMQQAKAESSFNPTAQAKTSSATGLYQFINSTWMDMVDKHGDTYGIDTETLSKSEILALRNDPEIASNMAAEFALENKRSLEMNWGGDVGSTELYLAHFLGAGSASAFLNAKDENQFSPAADLFPKAANANRGVFYNSHTGEPRSIGEVYAFFDKKFQIDSPQIQSNNDALENSVIHNDAPQDDTYAAFLLSELERRGYDNPFENFNARQQQTDTFARYTSPQSVQSLVQNPVALMILAEMDMPYHNGEKTDDNSSLVQSRAQDLFL